jgi:hypothetical protein
MQTLFLVKYNLGFYIFKLHNICVMFEICFEFSCEITIIFGSYAKNNLILFILLLEQILTILDFIRFILKILAFTQSKRYLRKKWK